MSKVFPLLGFDIGGTKIAICLGDSTGKMYGSKRVDNKNRPPEDVIGELVKAGHELIAEHKFSMSDIRAIGIGSPGPLDFEKGMIGDTPNMKTWRNFPIRDRIAEAFKIPTYFDNDANGAAVAEWIFGSGKGVDNMIYLTMSTGIGAGIIVNDRLLRGRDCTAGECGHIVLDINGPVCNCGMKGCYEAFCGGRALAQRMQKELADKPNHKVIELADGKIENVDMKALEFAVRAGDEYAVKLWDEMCFRNAQAFGTFINTFNPDMIVLGTIAIAAGDLFMEPVLKYLPQFCWSGPLKSCKITTSALGKHIGEYAGIAVALNFLYEKGEWELPWKH